MSSSVYIAIDLKSFYASVECIDRSLNPLDTNLVVADAERTSKTICLAVTPPLKNSGISGRPRLFEVISRVRDINAERRLKAKGHRLSGSSFIASELEKFPNLAFDYIAAKPRMARYIEVSTAIYRIYLKYVSEIDIYPYSIDEVFIDASSYLKLYGLSAYDFAAAILIDVFKTTGITAVAGIGANIYLSKVAMDIVAKHKIPDKDGVRIASLDEMSYRRLLWSYRPLTDFWYIGAKTAKKLESVGLYTMGDIARCSIGSLSDYYNEELLYKLFGVNAEFLIDHAWGYEPCTIEHIKSYKPECSSMGSGQVLHEPYIYEKARLVLQEMADELSLDLVKKNSVSNKIVITLGYDCENLKTESIRSAYCGKVRIDRYGRLVPEKSHGTINIGYYTSSARVIVKSALLLFDKIVNRNLLIRRLNISAENVIKECSLNFRGRQLTLLSCFSGEEENKICEDREKKLQEAIISIKRKFGKNAILKCYNLKEGATARNRNVQIGGHKA